MSIGDGRERKVPPDEIAEDSESSPGEADSFRLDALQPQRALPASEKDIPRLREEWEWSIRDIACPIPERLPPLREINHEINLIDNNKQYGYRHPKCPDKFVGELSEKISRYMRAGWWIPKAVRSAMPMLCVPKKSGKLRTVFDCRERNANTVKDATPFPDQDRIRNDVARARYRSKIDMSEAYEQIRIVERDVHKTGFSTIHGTFVSTVIQQGDCNAPSTFQRLMTHLFRTCIGRYVHCYLDDIFIYSDSIEDHQRHLDSVFKILRENQLYLSQSKEKVDLYSLDMDCLGYRIDKDGIHCDTTKMEKIAVWPTPQNYHDIQRFNGLVNYIGNFLPDIAFWTGQLSSCCQDQREFKWTDRLDKCFNKVKEIVASAPILKPIDPNSQDPIFLVCDASIHGIGAMYGQGSDWKSCRPAGFMSRKFTTAQSSYFTMEQEALAILEALKTWEDKFMGRKFTIITDHEALKYLMTKKNLTRRETRWADYLSRFNFDIIHVPGEENRVADCLSRYYSNDKPSDHREEWEHVSIDRRLDPDGEDLPGNRPLEIKAYIAAALRRKKALNDAQSERAIEAEELEEAVQRDVDRAELLAEDHDADPEAHQSVVGGTELPTYLSRYEEFSTLIRSKYPDNPYFAKVISKPADFDSFSVEDGLVYHTDRLDHKLLCIPRETFLRGRRMTELIIDHAHSILGHFGPFRTSSYIRRYYWWPTLTKDVLEFCQTCGRCQMNKPSNQRPQGLLKSLPIPSRPWESVGIDFLGPLPTSESHNYLMVVICRLTSMVRLVPTRTDVKASGVADLYYRHIWKFHGLPASIVSDRDSKFTSAFWRELNAAIGTKLLMSTAYHPQTDGATERANRTVSQILRSIIKPNQLDWVSKLPTVEFAINSSVNASTGYAPFELNYGYLPDSTGFFKSVSAAPGIREFAEKARWNLLEAHDQIIASRILQTYHANRRRREEPGLKVGDLAYLSTENLQLPKSRARKLLPRFIGPYRITEYSERFHTARLALPEELRKRRVHDVFHVSKLRKANENDLDSFPHRDVVVFYDFGHNDELEYTVQDIIAHRWEGRDSSRLKFYLRFDDGDCEWRDWAQCDDLQALDQYLELKGVKNPLDLPKENATRA
jgi:transposase InsO family protein